MAVDAAREEVRQFPAQSSSLLEYWVLDIEQIRQQKMVLATQS
jgi:hypothetical protein